MRFDDLIKKPAKPQKPLTYTESLQAKLDAEMADKPAPKFTALEYAMMEGGHSLEENFADGKKAGRKGLSKRVGVSQKMSISQLKKIASTATGERRRMAQWNLNMKRGRKRNK